MILSDFLSRQKHDISNPHDMTPISLNMQNILHNRYYNICELNKEGKYLIQTRLQCKSSSITLPAVHGMDKGINPSVKPEKQVIKPIRVASEVRVPTQIKPRIGQCRSGLRKKVNFSKPPKLNMTTQVTNKPILQNSKSTTQSQTSLESGP